RSRFFIDLVDRNARRIGCDWVDTKLSLDDVNSRSRASRYVVNRTMDFVKVNLPRPLPNHVPSVCEIICHHDASLTEHSRRGYALLFYASYYIFGQKSAF